MSNTLEIIPAKEEHRDYVVSIIEKRWQLSKEDANFEFNRWLANDKNSICYVGTINNIPMATGVFDTNIDEEIGITPYNTLLWVEPQCRGNSYGIKLRNIRFKWAKEKGYKEVFLDTHSSREYHEKNGWEFIKHIQYKNLKMSIMKYNLDNYNENT